MTKQMNKIINKLKLINALVIGGKSVGERTAAKEAHRRIMGRLTEYQIKNKEFDCVYSNSETCCMLCTYCCETDEELFSCSKYPNKTITHDHCNIGAHCNSFIYKENTVNEKQ